MSKQRPRDIVKEQHERCSLEEALNLLNLKKGCDFKIIARPDPPDAIISAGQDLSWMEHVDSFRNDDEAKEIFSHATPGETPYQRREQIIASPDDRIAHSILCKMRNKLGKESYKPCFEKYGKGILIITVQDPLFSEASFVSVENELNKFYGKFRQSSLDRGYFKEIYLRFRLSFWIKYGLMQLYPKLEERIIPDDVKPESMLNLEKAMTEKWSLILQESAKIRR